jgi:hypothetical protein
LLTYHPLGSLVKHLAEQGFGMWKASWGLSHWTTHDDRTT